MKLLAVLVLLGAAAVDAQSWWSWWSWFSTPAIDDSTPACSSGYQIHNGICYKAFNTTKNFYDASSTCVADGGTLAMPKDTDTNAFLINLKNAVDNSSSFRFGLTDLNQEGDWIWEDNVTLSSFRPWGPGEPNNVRDEDCAEFFSGSHSSDANAWNDGSCTNNDTKFICQATPSAGTWRGFRYVKDNDPAVTLLFDKNGFIAGLQMGVRKSELPSDGSIPPGQITPPWIEDKDMWLLTAYFIQPSDICSDGRTEAEYQDEGTGTDLYIQTGPNPTSDIMAFPLQQPDLEGTEWTEGKCFWGMCKHYWWNLRVDMDCKELFPVFIMYNGGKLDAFGWNIGTYLDSPRYEHPPPGFGTYKDPVPTCLADRSRIVSTMHVYLTNGYPPFFNHC
ncbi:CD209 [Branchiostoma lanceolatum]|uniref:CD209 protein n=1 Tax=Branchiostoma lanceolatum TaxID=7740 RepID=A0A8J9ZQB3_BRALA|nr:CD209 [Branchiostoma lanceolatum]